MTTHTVREEVEVSKGYMSPLENRSCLLAAMCLLERSRGGKQQAKQDHFHCLVIKGTFCHGSVQEDHGSTCLQTPRCGTTRVSSPQGSPQQHGPFLPLAAPAQPAVTRVAPGPDALPLLSCIKLLRAVPLAGATASSTATVQ